MYRMTVDARDGRMILDVMNPTAGLEAGVSPLPNYSTAMDDSRI